MKGISGRLIVISMMAVLGFVTWVPGIHAATYTYNPTNDAFVWQGNILASYNTTLLTVGVTSSEPDRTYLMFNVSSIPSNEKVTSARLYLYASGSYTHEIDLHNVTNDTWSEAGLTWKNQPGYDSTIMSYVSNVSTGWIALTVDPLVFTDDSISLLLKNAIESGGFGNPNVSFYSSEISQTEHRPYLQVRTASTTTTVPIPAAAWLLGSGLLGLIGIRKRKAR
jgi:hypothetical protein